MSKYSDIKIAWFPDKMQSFVDGRVTAPIYMRVKPINQCIHNFYFCIYKSENSDQHEDMNVSDVIPEDKMLEFLDDAAEMGVKCLTFSGGGEPLLHPYAGVFMSRTLSRGMGLSIITNGQLLEGDRADILARADWVRISMDYWNADMFEKTRRVKREGFYKTIGNITKFANSGRSCELQASYIITEHNYNTLLDAYEFIDSLGIESVRFTHEWRKDFSEYHSKIADDVLVQLSQIKERNCKLSFNYLLTGEGLKGREYSRCYSSEISPVLGADMNVYPCHNRAYCGNGIIGSIKDQRFIDMWYSTQTKDFLHAYNPKKECGVQGGNDSKNRFIIDMLECYGDNYV